MEDKNGLNANVMLAFVSFCSSFISKFLMYYIFATIALVTGIMSANDERTKKLSISAIGIVAITFVAKIVTVLLQNGTLPNWLINGIV